jgi:membrane-associated protein
LDKTLVSVVATYGTLVYVFSFLIIFMETGFVVTPFLPGDSLIFAAAAIAATGSLNIVALYLIFLIAAILGDTANYWIGHYIGPKVFDADSKFIKKKYLLEAHKFYEKHGPKAITLARFVPIVRTFAPFIAGVAKMDYKQFISYNILGGFLWVSLFSASGYFFGNLPFVKENFHYIVLVIIFISLVPMAISFFQSWRPGLRGPKA